MWVDVEQGRLFVEVTGRGPPLLMLHGWPLDHRIFAPQRDALSARLEVIAYDRRGFGRSEAPPDLRREVDDIDRILDALALSSVHLLGMSQGGRIAIRYAVTRAERLRSLVLQGAVVESLEVPEPEAERIPIGEYAALAKAGRLDDVRRRWLAHPMMRFDEGCEAASQLVARILADYAGTDLVTFNAGSYAFAPDVPAALCSLERPTLLLTGRNDTAARRRHAREIRARVPDCDEVVLERSGHLGNLTEPARYNRAVIEFCERVESARTRS